jgi:hypothetical protein
MQEGRFWGEVEEDGGVTPQIGSSTTLLFGMPTSKMRLKGACSLFSGGAEKIV